MTDVCVRGADVASYRSGIGTKMMMIYCLRVNTAGKQRPEILISAIFICRQKIGLRDSSSRDKADDDNHDSEHKQDVNKAAHRVGRNES